MRHRWIGLAMACGVLVCVAVAAQDKGEAKDQDFPPRVVKTEPADRARHVDPDLTEIRVTFDRPMKQGRNWSWILMQAWGEYPGDKALGEPAWENGGKTCVLKVSLRAGTTYAVGVNSFRHTGFQDSADQPAVPFTWVFKTRKP
jgi:hypothetical protein